VFLVSGLYVQNKRFELNLSWVVERRTEAQKSNDQLLYTIKIDFSVEVKFYYMKSQWNKKDQNIFCHHQN